MRTDRRRADRTDAGRVRRPAALISAALLLMGVCTAFSAAGPAAADPVGDCAAGEGALVAVDFGPFGGAVERGCDATPTTGYELLHDAGFTTTGTQHDGPGFICRIGYGPFDSGTQYPAADQEGCVLTPPTTAYWSYWIAAPGQEDWSYSPYGATDRRLGDGDVDAWVFGGGTQPGFSPTDVREGGVAAGPGPSATGGASQKHGTQPSTLPASGTGPSRPRPGASPGPGPSGSAADPSAGGKAAASAAAAPDLENGVAYLTGKDNLKDGHYYPSGQGGARADFGLTLDGALALAATGLDDSALRGIVDFLAHGGKDGDGRTVHDWTGVGTEYAAGGSLGKTALLAEAVGRDPRDFGGKDLVAALGDAVCTAPSTGADRSCAAKGAYTYAPSVFSHCLAVMAQLRAGEKAAAEQPLAYLEGMQQDSGAWPSLIPATDDADVDSTAVAAMTLALAGDEAGEAVDKALVWLAGRQLSDGGFPGAAGDSVNSAALAVQGLSLHKDAYASEIAKARAFLASQQNPDGGFNVAKEAQRGSDLRASAQAVGGATGISFGVLEHSLSGTSPQPTPGTSTPPIVTPGDTGQAGGPSAAGGSDGGALASTGAQIGALTALAVVLVLAGWRTAVVARRRAAGSGGGR